MRDTNGHGEPKLLAWKGTEMWSPAGSAQSPLPKPGLVSLHAFSIQMTVHESFLVSHREYIVYLDRVIICCLADTPKVNVAL